VLIDDPKKFADDLGNLHDARIETMDYSASDQTLALGVSDLNAVFRNWAPTDTPEPDARPATLLFSGVTQLQFGLALQGRVVMGALEVEAEEGSPKLRIALADGGIPGIAEKWWITARFTTMQLLEPTS
jgi:hypothetical protein